MKPRYYSLILVVGLTCGSTSFAATLRVDGLTYRDLRAAYASARDGDIIEVPAGEFAECIGGFSPPKRVQIVPVGGSAIIHGAACEIPNDSFSNPIILSGIFTNAGGRQSFQFTREGCEKGILGSGGAHSLWWSWTSPSNGLARITSQDFSTHGGRVAGVFIGSSVCNLLTITSAQVDPEFSDTPVDALFFDATSNVTYHIAFDSTSLPRSVAFQLELIPHPENDELSRATRLSGYWALASGTTLAATTNAADPRPFGNIAAGKTAWWIWTAPASGRPGRPAVVSTAGSKFDTLLAIYRQTSSGLALVASNDDHGPQACNSYQASSALTSQASFVPEANASYYILVDGAKSQGDLLMHYAGDVRVSIDYSTLDISSLCFAGTNRCDRPANDSLVSGSLRITHYGDTPTRGLRVSFRVARGFSMNINFAPTDEFRTPTNSYHLPAGLPPGASATVDYANVSFPCPDPDVEQSGGNDGAKGWAVFAVLEEDFDNAWVPVDSTLITYGPWPFVPPFGGPNGGVIRSDPSRPPPNYLTDIRITGPGVLCENYNATIVGQAVFDLGYSNAQPDWSWSGPVRLSTNGLKTNAVATVTPLTADATATISASLSFAGSRIPATAPLTLSLLNNCAEFSGTSLQNNSLRFDYIDQPGKHVAIDYTTNLSDQTQWLQLQTATLSSSGRLVLSNSIATNGPVRFFRARELP